MPEERHAEQQPASIPPQRSGWAVASLLSSLTLCPVATILAPALGIKALIDIRNSNRLTGRAIAIAGIVIGTLITAAWIAGGVWAHINIRQEIIEGPIDELRAGLANDLDGFRAGFHGPATQTSDIEIMRFLATLSRRYGDLREIRIDESRQADTLPHESGRSWVPYQFVFDRDIIDAEVEFILFSDDQTGILPVAKFGRIRMYDPDRGDFTFPTQTQPQDDRMIDDDGSDDAATDQQPD